MRASVLMLTAFACTALACGDSDSAGPTPDEEDALRCESTNDCEAGLTCCNFHCDDVQLSVRSCGACGATCTVAEYCDGSACLDLDIRALCAAADFTVVHRAEKDVDGQPDDPSLDNQASDDVADAFHTFCGGSTPAPVPMNEADLYIRDSGLVTGRGTTLIVAGGRVYSDVIAYLDDTDVTPVELIVTAESTFQLVARSERRVIVEDSLTALNENRDYIVGQAVYDEKSGTWVLNVYGIFQPGTQAAAAYFSDQIQNASFGARRWFIARYENGTITQLAGE